MLTYSYNSQDPMKIVSDQYQSRDKYLRANLKRTDRINKLRRTKLALRTGKHSKHQKLAERPARCLSKYKCLLLNLSSIGTHHGGRRTNSSKLSSNFHMRCCDTGERGMYAHTHKCKNKFFKRKNGWTINELWCF